MLDPATLTPATLYKLQSETWVQGANYERERIIKLLQNQYNAVLDNLGIALGLEQLDILAELIGLIEGEKE